MLLICYGTRPEYIKLKPLIKKIKGLIDYRILFTGQHEDIGNFDHDLSIKIKENPDRLNSIFASILESSCDIFQNVSSVMVMGDTASATAVAIAAFNKKIKIIHLEAGLRTYDMGNPHPEEGYRQIISRLTDIHLCPTRLNKLNLEQERVGGEKHITGNTVLDNLVELKTSYSDEVLITMHRRENHQNLTEWFSELSKLALSNKELRFTIPLHPNPNVQKHKEYLIGLNVTEPMNYEEMKRKLCGCKFVISDSGGLQEEASFLRKKIIVCRKTTERKESLGETSFICESPDKLKDVFDVVKNNFNVEESYICPYGDGLSSSRILKILNQI
jgi:UDP-N-acetylglucosamine 2-epimerase (non-hydrolysing)